MMEENTNTDISKTNTNNKRNTKKNTKNANTNKTQLLDILFSIDAYYVTIIPVIIAMIFTNCIVSNIPTIVSEKESIDVYILNDDDNNNNDNHNLDSNKLNKSIINAIVIITVIGITTFGIVFLYYIKCTKCLSWYLTFSSFTLLSLVGGIFFSTMLNTYNITMDACSFIFMLYNFTIVGLLSIYYQKGIPQFIQQSYIIFISSMIAWQLSTLDEYTTWSLLVALALYDICAVLTPCGPLRCLVNLMEKRQVVLPGLLYEANFNNNNNNNNNYNKSIKRKKTKKSIEMMSISSSYDKNSNHTSSSKKHQKYELVPASTSLDEIEKNENSDNNIDVSLDELEKKNEYKSINQQRNVNKHKNSIKLGVGDFVFYSVLVTRARLSIGILGLITSSVAIATGLLITLIFLSKMKRALPALPSSILLACLFTLLTSTLLIPYLKNNHIGVFV